MKSLIRKVLMAGLMAVCLPAASFAAEFTLKYGHVGPVTSDDQVPGEILLLFHHILVNLEQEHDDPLLLGWL